MQEQSEIELQIKEFRKKKMVAPLIALCGSALITLITILSIASHGGLVLPSGIETLLLTVNVFMWSSAIMMEIEHQHNLTRYAIRLYSEKTFGEIHK